MKEDSRFLRLRESLAVFEPLRLEIKDDSARHASHAGNPGGRETHLLLVMVSAAFAGKSPVERARMVHKAVAGEWSQGLHALNLTLLAPGEDEMFKP